MRQHGISIHALREEGDRIFQRLIVTFFKFLSTPSARRATCQRIRQAHRIHISIHALREEGDNNLNGAVRVVVEFLSTPSARRATLACRCTSTAGRYFYPRPPRGGRRQPVPSDSRFHRISIHALREEGDALIASLLPQ